MERGQQLSKIAAVAAVAVAALLQFFPGIMFSLSQFIVKMLSENIVKNSYHKLTILFAVLFMIEEFNGLVAAAGQK